jgi:hypothetical protein
MRVSKQSQATILPRSLDFGTVFDVICFLCYKPSIICSKSLASTKASKIYCTVQTSETTHEANIRGRGYPSSLYVYLSRSLLCLRGWMRVEYRARIFKLLSTPGIDSTEAIPYEKHFHIVELILGRVGQKEGPENEDKFQL